MKSLLSIAVLSFAITLAGVSTSDAPTGFDNQSNGLVDQATHQADQAKFDEVESVSDGLGPLYNAQSCRECHQNPTSGGNSQVAELRVGHDGVMDVMTVIVIKGDLGMNAEQAEATKSTRKRVREPKSKKAPVAKKPAKVAETGRGTSKSAVVLGLLRKRGGVTTAELIEATGWQPHTVRGFLAGTVRKKLGFTVSSTKRDSGERSYSIEA